MPIPSYEDLMLPVLRILENGETLHIRDIGRTLAQHFGLTDDDLALLIPSGLDSLFDNRFGWARTHMKKAGLIESPARAQFRITPRGRELLASNPTRIDVGALRRYPEFIAFSKPSRVGGVPQSDQPDQESATPLEAIEAGYGQLRDQLADEILQAIRNATPRFFEQLVIDVLVKMGYGGSLKDAGAAVGRSGDGGVDGIIKEDRLGLDQIYIQAKRWANTVGRPEIQAFAGSLQGYRARKGVFITTSQFSAEAKEYVTRIETRIVLIDGDQLAGLMMDFGVGVTEVASYHVKKLDPDYFEE